MSDTSPSPATGPAARVAAAVAWVQRQRPVRVLTRFNEVRGPILSSGLAFQAIFAGFAAIWIGFSVIGLVAAGDSGLRETLIEFIARTVPGLIDEDGSGAGAIDPALLLDAGGFGWSGAFATVGLIVAGLGWLASAREAVRTIFGLPPDAANFFLMKLKDLGIALLLGVAMIVSALLSVAGTQATGFALGLVGINEKSVIATIVGRVIVLAVMFALDAVVLGILFRILSGVRIPWDRLRSGVLVGAAGFGVLKVLGSALLGGARNNPLLASFAVIAGLLIWFNLLCQVMLIASSWIYVGMTDRGVPVDPEGDAKRAEQERRLVEARQTAAQADAPRGLARIFRRRRH